MRMLTNRTALDYKFATIGPLGDVYLVAGEELCWDNVDTFFHTSTSQSSSAENWDSGLMAQGDTFCRTFTTTGTFPYQCSIHLPIMVGNVIVMSSSSEFPPGANELLGNAHTIDEVTSEDTNNEVPLDTSHAEGSGSHEEGYYSHIVIGLLSSQSDTSESLSDIFDFTSMSPLTLPSWMTMGLLLIPFILFLS